MAVAFVKTHGGEFVKAAGATDTYFTVGTVVPAGRLLVMVLVHDNAATANSPTVSSISTAAGETASWVLIGRGTYPIAATAGGFANGEMWAIKTTVEWPGSTALTVTYSTSITMKAQFILEFAGAETTLRCPVASTYATVSQATSVTTTGTTPAVGDLVVGFGFQSNAAVAHAGDSDTTGGAWSTAVGVGSTGGSTATNNFGIAQYKILTSASHQTYGGPNPLTVGNGVIAAVFQATPPTPAVTQTAYQFYADGTNTGSTALAAQNTPPSVDMASGDVNLQLRLRLQETGSANMISSDVWQLQYDKNASDSWSDVTTSSSVVAAYNSANLSGTLNGGSRLGAGTGVYYNGNQSETGSVIGPAVAAGNYTEGLYSISLKQADLADADTLRFRVLRNGATTGMTYTQVPTINLIKTSAPTQQGAADLTAISTLSASGTAVTPPTQQASASLSAVSTLSADGTATHVQTASAALSAASVLTATAVRVPQAAASLTAVSTLTTSGARIAQASVALTATSTLTATGVKAAGGATAYRLLDSFTPPTEGFHDGNFITVGMEFYVTAEGCTATKGYFPNSGRIGDTWTMKLWQVDSATAGTLLASKTSPAILAGDPLGWLPVTFDTPIPLTVDQRYRITGTPAFWYYNATSAFWSSGAGHNGGAGLTAGPLRGPSSSAVVDGDQGSYVYSDSVMPTEHYQGGNYWVDVEVEQAGAGPKQGVAALVAVSTLTATATRVPQAAVSLSAVSTLTATAVRVPQAAASLSATSTLTATSVRIPQAAAALTAVSALSATAVVTGVTTGAANLSAVSTLSATAVVTGVTGGTAALIAVSTLSATAVREPQAAGSLVAVSTLTATAVRQPLAAAVLTATSTLTVTAVGIGVIAGAAALSATSTLTVTGVRQPQAAAALSAASTLVATAVRVPQAAAAFTTTSTLTVGAVREVQASATLSATSTLGAAAGRTAQPAAALVATSTLTTTAVGIGIVSASAALNAVSTLTATGVRTPLGSASLVGTSTLTVTALRTRPASVALTATSTLTATAAGFGVTPASVALSATATLSVTAVRQAQGGVALSATATLSITATRTPLAGASLSATSTLTVVAVSDKFATVALVATSTLGATGVTVGAITGQPKVWNGTAWVKHPAKVWTGAAWPQKPIKKWDGSSWVPVN
jgi:hypothetical protein